MAAGASMRFGFSKGQQFGGYRILGVLGAGNMGAVHLARQESMDRLVALKVLPPQRVRQRPDYADMFLREARSVAVLDHPGIIRVHDAGSIDHDHQPLLYFAMEYVDGESLQQVLDREGACDAERIATVMGDMAGILAYAARKELVHRDIKPGNLMLSREGRVKLADFGLIKLPSDEDDGRVMGTPYYMSPEHACGLGVDYRSDQYSLGCVLFQMLTGTLPYLGTETASILQAHVHDPVPDPQHLCDCSQAWAQISMRLMAKAPADRYTDPEELLAAVAAAVGEAPQAAAPRPAQLHRQVRARQIRAKRARAHQERLSRGRRTQRAVTPPVQRSPHRTVITEDAVPDDPSEAVPEETRQPWTMPGWLVHLGGGLADLGVWIWDRCVIIAAWLADVTVYYGGILLGWLSLALSWLVARIVAMMPFVRRFIYWLTPYVVQTLFIPIAGSWRVRIVSGHHHLLTSQDERQGFITAVHHGRNLPGLWPAVIGDHQPWQGLWPRRWWRLVIGRIVGYLGRLGSRRAQRLSRALHDLRRRPQAGLLLPFDSGVYGHCGDEIIAMARTAGVPVLPMACAATPAHCFSKSWDRLMIPLPFATIQVAFGPPVDVGSHHDAVDVAIELEDIMADLQADLDAQVGVHGAPPRRQ